MAKIGDVNMRLTAVLLLPLSVAAVAGCTPSVPNSGQGVGFQNYNSYGQQGVNNGYGAAFPQQNQGAATSAAPAATFSTESIGAAIDRAGQGGAATTSGTGYEAPYAGYGYQQSTGALIGGQSGGVMVTSQTQAPPVVVSTGNRAISDEQSFEAVASRETIQSDKERIERNKAQYQVVQPGALPTRSGSGSPNIVQYALSTQHPKGASMYSRSSFGYGGWINNCGQYASPDLAQEAFLANGGPSKDGKKLDPDGDGYACAWDPSPFRMR